VKALKEAYQNYFKIGAAVNRRTIRSHADLIKTHFDSITCENEMKPALLYDRDGNPDSSGADEIYTFARENNLEVRGHTLIWHNQMPPFFSADKDREKSLALISAHMKRVAETYDANLYAWDVVNEAIEDKSDVYLRQTQWLEIFGTNYISEMFKLAGQFFKNKALYYNDYNETNPVKREKIARLVKELQAEGAPIHGVGMQAHYNIYGPSLDEIEKSIELYAGLGVKISVTEMDVSLFQFGDHLSLPAPAAELLEKQAEYYRQCFSVFRAYKDHIDSVTLWGVADDATWLDNFPVRGRKNWPLLFDENHQGKEAFRRVVEF